MRSDSHNLRKSAPDTTVREIEPTIRLMNAGLVHHSSCGQVPLGVTPAAAATGIGRVSLAPFVTVTWSASTDEAAGEKDVVRYAIYRHLDVAGAVFDEPISSIPAGSTSYSFADTDVITGQKWIYGVAVQDCTPALSPIGSALSVTVP